jgi:hypothetical protein
MQVTHLLQQDRKLRLAANQNSAFQTLKLRQHSATETFICPVAWLMNFPLLHPDEYFNASNSAVTASHPSLGKSQ